MQTHKTLQRKIFRANSETESPLPQRGAERGRGSNPKTQPQAMATGPGRGAVTSSQLCRRQKGRQYDGERRDASLDKYHGPPEAHPDAAATPPPEPRPASLSKCHTLPRPAPGRSEAMAPVPATGRARGVRRGRREPSPRTRCSPHNARGPAANQPRAPLLCPALVTTRHQAWL